MLVGEIDHIIIYDSTTSNRINKWYIVNDGVMGGYSIGSFSKDKRGNGVFSGDISLYNNGGFSSVRCNFKKLSVSPNDTLMLNVNGDNKYYQIRTKHSTYDRHVYTKRIFIKNGWHIIKIPLSNMTPSFRGRRLMMNNFDKSQITEIGILIGNKVEEKFNLKINFIHLSKSR